MIFHINQKDCFLLFIISFKNTQIHTYSAIFYYNRSFIPNCFESINDLLKFTRYLSKHWTLMDQIKNTIYKIYIFWSIISGVVWSSILNIVSQEASVLLLDNDIYFAHPTFAFVIVRHVFSWMFTDERATCALYDMTTSLYK